MQKMPEHTEKYTLTLTYNQVIVVRNALEEYFRLSMNQWSDLAERLAFRGIEMQDNNNDFDTLIMERNLANGLFTVIGRVINDPYRGTPMCENENIAVDIWHVIKHELWEQREDKTTMMWSVDASEPWQTSEEPLPKIEVTNNE
jgi:hypothetical protein